MTLEESVRRSFWERHEDLVARFSDLKNIIQNPIDLTLHDLNEWSKQIESFRQSFFLWQIELTIAIQESINKDN